GEGHRQRDHRRSHQRPDLDEALRQSLGLHEMLPPFPPPQFPSASATSSRPARIEPAAPSRSARCAAAEARSSYREKPSRAAPWDTATPAAALCQRVLPQAAPHTLEPK